MSYDGGREPAGLENEVIAALAAVACDVYDLIISYTSKVFDADEAGVTTKREAVEKGLKLLLRLEQQKKIRNFRGKLRWEGDLEAMRRD